MLTLAKSEGVDFRLLHQAADRLTPKLRRTLLNAFENLPEAALTPLIAALEAGRIDEVMALLAASVSPAEQAKVAGVLAEAFSGAANLQGAEFNLRFDIKNPQAVRWAEANAAKLVTSVDNQTRSALRDIVVRGIQDGIPPASQAREIRQLIGLSGRDATAADNFFRGLMETASTDKQQAQALSRFESYQRRLLRQRAETIARTETIRAANMGQRAAWDAAADGGLIDRSSTRIVWIATEDSRTCLPVSTVITTPDGPRLIADLIPGDSVHTPAGDYPISATTRRDYDGEYVTLLASNGKMLTATADHRHWSDGWKRADSLSAGDSLGDKGHHIIGSVQFGFKDMHNPPALLDKLGVPFGVLSRVVPVGAVNFQGDVPDGEVDEFAADWMLLPVADSEGVEGVTDDGFDSCFSAVCPIAVVVAESGDIGAGRFNSERFATMSAIDVTRRSPAFLRAVDERAALRLESLATSTALSDSFPALAAAPLVSVGDAGEDTEGLAAFGADLLSFGAAGSVVTGPVAVPSVSAVGGSGQEEVFAAVVADEVLAWLAWLASGTAHTVYDITVVGQECFYADGFLTHNCPICAVLDGQTVGFEESFSVREQATGFNQTSDGFEVSGTKPVSGGPHTERTPPAHPRCRCAVGLIEGVEAAAIQPPAGQLPADTPIHGFDPTTQRFMSQRIGEVPGLQGVVSADEISLMPREFQNFYKQEVRAAQRKGSSVSGISLFQPATGEQWIVAAAPGNVGSRTLRSTFNHEMIHANLNVRFPAGMTANARRELVFRAQEAARQSVGGNTTRMGAAEAADAAIARGVSPFWAERIREMANHGMTVSGQQFGDRTVARFASIRVTSASSWPTKGTITLTRLDGAKVTLRMTPTTQKFKVDIKPGDLDVRTADGKLAEMFGTYAQTDPEEFVAEVLAAAQELDDHVAGSAFGRDEYEAVIAAVREAMDAG